MSTVANRWPGPCLRIEQGDLGRHLPSISIRQPELRIEHAPRHRSRRYFLAPGSLWRRGTWQITVGQLAPAMIRGAVGSACTCLPTIEAGAAGRPALREGRHLGTVSLGVLCPVIKRHHPGQTGSGWCRLASAWQLRAARQGGAISHPHHHRRRHPLHHRKSGPRRLRH